MCTVPAGAPERMAPSGRASNTWGETALGGRVLGDFVAEGSSWESHYFRDLFGMAERVIVDYVEMRTLFLSFCASILFIAAAPRANAILVASLSIQSQPGDFVGQGQTLSIDYPATEIAAQIMATRPGGAPTFISFTAGHSAPPPNTSQT